MQEGIRLYREGKYQEALESFLRADLEQSDYPLFSYNLGLCYARLRKYEEALLYLEQVVTSDLDFTQVYQSRMLLGFIYSETMRLRLAAFEFRKLLEDGFESAKIYAALAHVLFLERHIEESISHAESALKLEPANPNALNSMGYILAESGNKLNLAFMYCSKAVKINPNNPTYLDSLGWVLHKQGRRKDAVGVLRKAVLLSPNSVTIRDHLQKALELV